MHFHILELAGVTQSQFAELLGVTRVTVNTWVKGRFSPLPKTRSKVQAALAILSSAVDAGTLPVPIVDRKKATDAALALIRKELDAGK